MTRAWLAFASFALIAGFFLWTEHRAHLFGARPYGLLLLCPALHLIGHRRHGSKRHDHGQSSGPQP